MDRALRRVLAGSGKFVVACSGEDPDTLVGWAASEGGDEFWTYVSKDFRGNGLGRILQASVVEYKSSTSVRSGERE